MSSSIDHSSSTNGTPNGGSNPAAALINQNYNLGLGYPVQPQQQQQHPRQPQQQQQQQSFHSQHDYMHSRQPNQHQQHQQQHYSSPYQQQHQQRAVSPSIPYNSIVPPPPQQQQQQPQQQPHQQVVPRPVAHNQPQQPQFDGYGQSQHGPHGHYQGQNQNSSQGQGQNQSQGPHTHQGSASVSVTGSSPARSEDGSNLRFRITLEAQTAAMQRQDETPVTYLNKGQYYTISLEDTEEYDGEITSVIKVTFHDASHQRLAARYWSFWLSQQPNPKTARALDIEKVSSSGMMEVQSKTFDRISFKWNGKAGAKLMVRFNCLSTDFSRIKGVKGIPLRVHMDTMLDGIGGQSGVINSNGNGSGNGDQQPAMERSFAKIKLFRDKGAERKNKDDHKHLEKMWDKMRGKNADTNPLVSMLAPVQSVSVFTECLDHPEGTGEDETLDLSETLTHDPDTDSGALAASGNNGIGASGAGASADIVGGAGAGQDTASSSVVESSVALVPATKKRRRAIESGGNSSNNGRQAGAQDQYRHSQVGFPIGSPSSSSELFLDRDPNYVPQSRKKKAVLCLYIKIGGESVYRAVYLEKCTLADLTQKLSEKLEIQSSTISCVYRKATKKELLVRVDDAMVAQMNDELDMVVDYDFNQLDGSVNLTLKY